MSQTSLKQPADRKKKTTTKAAEKAPARKVVAAAPKPAAKDNEIIEAVLTIKGKRYNLRATKWLVLKVMKGSAVITDWAEERDGDDKIEPHEVMELAELYETVVKLFSTRDGFAGVKAAEGRKAQKPRKSSRERIMEGLDDGELDFEDFEPAFKQLSAVRENAGGRPLG